MHTKSHKSTLELLQCQKLISRNPNVFIMKFHRVETKCQPQYAKSSGKILPLSHCFDNMNTLASILSNNKVQEAL